ncbi:uncharacterized protein LOC119690789 isoform X4 [Plutella xylostella]|uniref:uncharacterized protein LOC119690789 isoform X4 n=1 Tax=Plutella xylostella TaxID=51655 RepID=UPI002032C5D9|nr:uncharacterized protein LOC119690789 isoform X4 [Plutella xylostella]
MAAYTFAFAAIGLIALLGQTSGLPCATCPGGQWTAPPANQHHAPAPVQQQWQPQNPGLVQGLLGGPLLSDNSILNGLGSNNYKPSSAPKGSQWDSPQQQWTPSQPQHPAPAPQQQLQNGGSGGLLGGGLVGNNDILNGVLSNNYKPSPASQAPVQQQWQPQNPGLVQGLLGGPLLSDNSILNGLGSNNYKPSSAPKGGRGLISGNNIGDGILSNH